MSGDDAPLLAALPAWAFAFVLVMSRIGAAKEWADFGR